MENANKDTYTLGLDLGNATHALCVLNSTGEIVEENTIANEKEALSCLSARYPSSTIVMEAGTHCSSSARLAGTLLVTLNSVSGYAICALPRSVPMDKPSSRSSRTSSDRC